MSADVAGVSLALQEESIIAAAQENKKNAGVLKQRMVQKLDTMSLAGAGEALGTQAGRVFQQVTQEQKLAQVGKTSYKADRAAAKTQSEALGQKLAAKPSTEKRIHAEIVQVVSVSGLSRVETLERLYNCSQPARFFEKAPKEMLILVEKKAWHDKVALAEDLLKGPPVDYLGGRCIKTDLSTFPLVDIRLFKKQCEIEGSYEEIVERCFNSDPKVGP